MYRVCTGLRESVRGALHSRHTVDGEGQGSPHYPLREVLEARYVLEFRTSQIFERKFSVCILYFVASSA